MARSPETIEAGTILTCLYGQRLAACDTVRIVDDKRAVAQLTVRQQHCNPRVGYNLLNFLVKRLSGDEQPHMSGFDFFSYREPVPGQPICLNGNGYQKKDGRVSGTFIIRGEQQPFAKNFWVDLNYGWNLQGCGPSIAQDWIVRLNAQSLGIFRLYPDYRNVAHQPLQAGKSYFSFFQIYPGDRLTTILEITEEKKGDVLANATTFCNGVLVAEQAGLTLPFVRLKDVP